MEEDPFRPPWEDAEPPRASRPLAGVGGLLIPLVRAQDAVARLEASVAAAPEDIAGGLRARLALFEAAGYLAHHGAAVHPHDLALRDANLTGSYTVAAITGRLKATTPWTMEQAGEGPLPDDHVVANALAYARLWRRLAELATVQPLASVDTLAAPLAQLGAHLSDDEPTRTWLQALPGPADLPGLLAAAKVMATGLPGEERGEPLALGASYVAAALWRRHGYGRACALPFWSAPVSRIEALALPGGFGFQRTYLQCGRGGAARSPRTRAPARRLAPARRVAGERPLPAARGRRRRAPRAAGHRTPARPHPRGFQPRRARPGHAARAGRRAAGDDRAGGLAARSP